MSLNTLSPSGIFASVQETNGRADSAYLVTVSFKSSTGSVSIWSVKHITNIFCAYNALNAGLIETDIAANLRYFERHRPKAVSLTYEELKVKS